MAYGFDFETVLKQVNLRPAFVGTGPNQLAFTVAPFEMNKPVLLRLFSRPIIAGSQNPNFKW